VKNVNNSVSKKDFKFEFPESTLKQIAEFSSNGYLLFYTDQYGNIVPVVNFDNQISALSLLAYAKNFCEAINHTEIQSMINDFSEQDPPIIGDEE
jgi:hypothetical protein